MKKTLLFLSCIAALSFAACTGEDTEAWSRAATGAIRGYYGDQPRATTVETTTISQPQPQFRGYNAYGQPLYY